MHEPPTPKPIYFEEILIVGVRLFGSEQVGLAEALGLARNKLGLTGGFWDAVGSVNDHFELLARLWPPVVAPQQPIRSL